MAETTKTPPTDKQPKETGPDFLRDFIAMQSELPVVRKDATNPAFHSSYATLDAITETAFPVMTKHNFGWTCRPFSTKDGGYRVVYELMHASGQSIKGNMDLRLTKGDMQGLGSALTYARRYCFAAVTGIVTDEDDDGNAASGTPAAKRGTSTRPGAAKGTATPTDAPSDKQIDFAKTLLADKHGIKTPADLKVAYKIFGGAEVAKLHDLDRHQVSALIESLTRLDQHEVQTKILEYTEGTY